MNKKICPLCDKEFEGKGYFVADQNDCCKDCYDMVENLRKVNNDPEYIEHADNTFRYFILFFVFMFINFILIYLSENIIDINETAIMLSSLILSISSLYCLIKVFIKEIKSNKIKDKYKK